MAQKEKIRLVQWDPENPKNMEALRVYIPLKLSRANIKNRSLELTPALSEPLIELFDYKFALEYVDSYPNEDKFRSQPRKVVSDSNL